MDITSIPTLKNTIAKLTEHMSRSAPHHFERDDNLKNKEPILVLEGHGVVAHRVVARLLAAGYPNVRVGIPDPPPTSVVEAQMADQQVEEGAEVVEFNWEKPETYDRALQDVKTLFCIMPHHKNWESQFQAFLEAAKRAKVKNFVKLSFYHALASASQADNSVPPSMTKKDPFLEIPLVLMHRSCDEKLMKAAPVTMNYCILFASHFMSNPLVYQSESIRKKGKFYGASAGKGVNYVSPNDVAECAVRILLAPQDHHRIGYTLTGPAAVKDTKVAELLSKHLKNKTVTYVDQPWKTFATETVQDTDWGPALDVVYLELAKASGTEEQRCFVTKDIEKICGRAPEKFDEYLGQQDYFTPQELLFLKQ